MSIEEALTKPLIHVGFMKTGSTWLQESVFSIHSNLGFVPVDNARARAIASFVAGNPYAFCAKEAVKLFNSGIPGYDQNTQLVISEETLCGSPNARRYDGPTVADRIHMTFPQAKILITVREQKAAALSFYKEYILQGGECTLDEFIGTGKEALSHTPILPVHYLKYHYAIDHYKSLFGEENVLVLLFEMLKDDPIIFVRKIQNFCRLSPAGDVNTKIVNAGLPAGCLNLRRMMNYFYKISPINPAERKINRKIIDLSTKVIGNVVPTYISKRAEKVMKEKINNRYKEVFIESNKNLSEKIGIDMKAFGYDA